MQAYETSAMAAWQAGSYRNRALLDAEHRHNDELGQEYANHEAIEDQGP